MIKFKASWRNEMKKLIIILILLSMISVIGCSNDQELDQEILVEILNEQEQEIVDLQKQIKELEAENKTLREGGLYLIEKLKEADDCLDNIYEAVEDANSGYITNKEAIGRILVNILRISDIFRELGIIIK